MQTSNRNESEPHDTESDKNERIELQPVFNMNNSALHYICAAGDYQQTESAKPAVQTSVLDLDIHF